MKTKSKIKNINKTLDGIIIMFTGYSILAASFLMGHNETYDLKMWAVLLMFFVGFPLLGAGVGILMLPKNSKPGTIETHFTQ